MILYSKISGKNITFGLASGVVTANTMITPNVVIARSVNHQQNAASGRSYLSSNGTILRYLDHYYSLTNTDSITEYY
jgi:hypothetical protein